MSYLVPFCSCVSSPFSIAITSLGEERTNLSALRMFDRFVLVWICRFPFDVWERLRFVIVALPGLFSYLFFRKLSVVKGKNYLFVGRHIFGKGLLCRKANRESQYCLPCKLC